MAENTETDSLYMQMALELAREAKGKTFPNPAVGAVVVSQGGVTGRGATQVYGGPHAEKVALAQAKEMAQGATLYVTLEPCCHFGRTPPCTDVIIASGIRKVFVSVKDPNPLVAGKGIKQLQEHGIDVSTGLLRQEAGELNEDFFWSIRRKQAWVTLKLAMTLDGRIADSDGNSKWITGGASREFVHELRRRHAAVAVGRATFEADNPQLSVRHKEGYNPARIIFSSNPQIERQSYFYQHASEARSIIVVAGGKASEIVKRSSIEYWYTGQSDQKLSLQIFLKMAYEQNLPSIFVEGGQHIASQLLEAGLVNRLYLFYGSKILGEGKDGFCFSNGLSIRDCITLKRTRQHVFGSDFLISGIPRYNFRTSNNNSKI